MEANKREDKYCHPMQDLLLLDSRYKSRQLEPLSLSATQHPPLFGLEHRTRTLALDKKNIFSCRFTFCLLYFFPIHSICPIIRYFSLPSCLVRSLFLLCFLPLLLLLLSGLCKDVRLHHLPQLLLRPLQPLHLIALHPPLVQL